MRKRRRADDFWASLGVWSKLKLIVAIFFIFSTIGLIFDMWQVGQQRAWYWVVAMAAISGCIALSWALAFLQSRVLFLLVPVTTFAQAVVTSISARDPSFFGDSVNVADVSSRLFIEGIGCIVLIALGYIFFVVFIWKEGRSQLRLRTEIALAEDIHSALVPPISVTTGRFEMYGLSSASSEVGGDLLDIFQQNGKVSLTIADVTGHGVSAGTLMGMVKSAMRMRLIETHSLERLMTDLNRVVCQVRSEGVFVTLACLQIDNSDIAVFSSAGHEPILHYRHATATVDRIFSTNMPLGVIDDGDFAAGSVVFERGDVFVMLTDGLTEVADAQGEEFGPDRIEQIIANYRDRPLVDMYEAVLSAVTNHGRQTDDQTMMLIRVL